MIKRLVSCIYADFHPWDVYWPKANTLASSNPADLEEGDILIVHGGADISPSLYNKAVSRRTWAGDRPSHRDATEWAMMQQAKKLGVPIIGICRGGQMLCALAGGHLIQHVNNHSGEHIVTTVDGEEFSTNSIHHQMMYPFNVKHEMLGWVKEKLSDVHLDVDEDVDVAVEPEYVYFPEVKGFAIQWHPEMMRASEKATQYIIKTINERL